MSTTPQERTRAFRLRRLDSAGQSLSVDDRAWLAEYSARTGRNVSPAPAPAPPPMPTPLPVPAPAPMMEAQAQAPASPGNVTIDFTAPQSLDTSLATVPPAAPSCACPIPDCPKCKRGEKGVLTCGTTGEKVYPPMSDAGSQAMAAGILTMIGMAVRLYRPDRRLVPPTPEERKQFAGSLREMALRRASWMGAVDDIFAVLFGVSTYGIRALNAPSVAPGAP